MLITKYSGIGGNGVKTLFVDKCCYYKELSLVKYLITGATGFVGKSVVKKLLSNDCSVSAVVRNKSFDLPESINQFVLKDLGDICSDLPQQNLVKSLKNVDVVIHMAARVHVMEDASSDPLVEFRKINRDATLALAKMAVDARVKRFVFISSIGVNGHNNKNPFTEGCSANPQEMYVISKYEAEIALFKEFKGSKMEVVVIRPPLVYGPNAPGNFASLMKWMNKQIPLPFGAIHNKRSLVAVDNLVDFIALCADREKSPKATNEVFLISDGEDVSTTQLLQKVAKSLNKRAWLLPVPVGFMSFFAKLLGKEAVANRLFGSLQVDSSKASDLLGWRPVVTMDEQLQKTSQTFLEKVQNK